MKTLSLFPVLFLLAQGCATIVSSSSKDVTFTSVPEGASVRIESKKPGRFYSATTPGTVKLSKKDSYFACFTLEGYHAATVPVDRSAGKATAGSGIGNVLLTGVILAPIAMGIDAASGAAASLPAKVHNDMVPLAEPAPGNAGSIDQWRAQWKEEKDRKHDAAMEQQRRGAR